MREPRNPFRLRLSEQIESEESFLRLFSPAVLDVFAERDLWRRVQIVRSAPGCGKTSLFRAFAPPALVALHRHRTIETYRDLYQRMTALGAVSGSGPRLLGVMLSCARNYALLEDLSIDSARKTRMLYSLLNARVVLSMLRAVSVLKELPYPAGLERVSLVPPPAEDAHRLPSDGRALYDWARALEKSVCDAIDSFGPLGTDAFEGHDMPFALGLLRPDTLYVDSEPVADRVVVMLDDVHKLTGAQRQRLFSNILDARYSTGLWLAERLEALNPDELLTNEMLATGATVGREYDPPINLENFWARSPSKFERAVTNIADRRAASAQDVPTGGHFSASLEESLDGAERNSLFLEAIQSIEARVRSRHGEDVRYTDWIAARASHEGVPRERAVAWRTLEILIERDLRKDQFTLEMPLAPQQMEERESGAARAAAEFFVCQEFGIPYYFGLSRISALSSGNIEQFLAFSGELFEEVLSSSLVRGAAAVLPAERQEALLRRVAQQRWDEIPRRLANGRDVHRFLTALRIFATSVTKRPNAPYAPGVTGFALSVRDRDRITDPEFRAKHPDQDKLVRVLSACVSHNLLDATEDRPQGKRGQHWMVFYLNRWLCLLFGLPLGSGGWRPQKVSDLCRWTERGVPSVEKEQGFL